MKICYIVYREDNVMVFDSQVLEYLQKLDLFFAVDSTELIVFRHQDNLKKKEVIEKKISKFINQYKTFATIAPPMSRCQLNIDAKRLKKYILEKYDINEQIAVICRGDFATYIAAKAFSNMPNSRILFDNRGLPVEESLMAHPTGIIHSINRKIKKISIEYAKDHCDMYNFVTNAMREYDLLHYKYSKNIPYTVIPTLYRAETIDENELNRIKNRENYHSDQFIITYVGSVAAWQSTKQLIDVIYKIGNENSFVRFFILTNGSMTEFESFPLELRKRIVIKSVPHNEMKYYLQISNIGIVIRDNNIVNKVAAPTKIAEYLTSGMKILYSGNIGILEDIKGISDNNRMIQLDSSDNWIKQVENSISVKKQNVNEQILAYFDMASRQKETIDMLLESFKNNKVR